MAIQLQSLKGGISLWQHGKTSDSLTFARIAELTGSTEATVKSRFRYGIGKLRKLINH